jgi:hypothetical protein
LMSVEPWANALAADAICGDYTLTADLKKAAPPVRRAE